MIVHIGTNSVETIRLLLRRFTTEDVEDMFYNWAGDEETCRFLSWGPHQNMDVTWRRVNSLIRNYAYQNTYHWAICLKDSNMAIGSVSVEIFNDKELSCEVGYCIGREYWNQGLMTEALRAVIHYLFFDVGYHKVTARHDVMNVASGRVMQKCGMKFEKIIPHAGLRRDGKYYDCAFYGRSIEEKD